MELDLDASIVVDGQEMSFAEFRERIKGMLARVPPRDVIAPNPLPSRFGGFWDLQFAEPTLDFAGDTCHVSCRYTLLANGVREAAGHIDFVKIRARAVSSYS